MVRRLDAGTGSTPAQALRRPGDDGSVQRWRRRSRRRGALLALLLPLLLAACAGGGQIPEDHYYRLLAAAVPQHLAAPALAGTLKVEPIETFGIYRERAILFARSDDPADLRQHNYHYWIDSPTRLIRDQLVDYLRASGIAGTVAGAQVGLRGDIRLRLTLKDFERIIHSDGTVSAKVRLDAVITDATNRPLRIASYRRDEPAEDGTMSASVAAFGHALSGIYAGLLQDLLSLAPGTGPASRSPRLDDRQGAARRTGVQRLHFPHHSTLSFRQGALNPQANVQFRHKMPTQQDMERQQIRKSRHRGRDATAMPWPVAAC